MVVPGNFWNGAKRRKPTDKCHGCTQCIFFKLNPTHSLRDRESFALQTPVFELKKYLVFCKQTLKMVANDTSGQGLQSVLKHRSIRDNYMPFCPVLKIKGTYK